MSDGITEANRCSRELTDADFKNARRILSMEVTEKEIGDTIIALSKSFNDKLMEKSESELEEAYWHFKWDASTSLEWNIYRFCDMLKLYGGFCRRWEEAKHGSCCVVERVRDKYIMPKISLFANQISGRLKSNQRAE